VIKEFQGEYRFLSNFWPCRVYYEGKKYPSVEHAYQAAKTLDLKKRAMIRKQITPGKAKRFGKTLVLRSDWDEKKLEIMEFMVADKFKNSRKLRKELLKTGRKELVEGNWWGDTFWGKCRGKGENHLGKILMKVREELKISSVL